MKEPSLPKPPGQRSWTQAVQRRPDRLFKGNYNLLAETPVRERLFESTPKGVPAEAHAPKIKPVKMTVPYHWSGH